MSENVKGLSSHEIIVALSSASSEAFVHIYYEDVDNRNHKSLDALVHVLEDSGFGEFAAILHKQQPYAVFANPQEALKAYQFANDHSAAVNVNLVYKGEQNKEAEESIKHDFPKAKESSGLHSFKHK